jgi:hypothetical protein
VAGRSRVAHRRREDRPEVPARLAGLAPPGLVAGRFAGLAGADRRAPPLGFFGAAEVRFAAAFGAARWVGRAAGRELLADDLTGFAARGAALEVRPADLAAGRPFALVAGCKAVFGARPAGFAAGFVGTGAGLRPAVLEARAGCRAPGLAALRIGVFGTGLGRGAAVFFAAGLARDDLVMTALVRAAGAVGARAAFGAGLAGLFAALLDALAGAGAGLPAATFAGLAGATGRIPAEAATVGSAFGAGAGAGSGRGVGASLAGAGGGSSRGAGGRGTPRSTATGWEAVEPVVRRTGTGGGGGTGGPSPRPMTPSAVSRFAKATTSLVSGARSKRTIAV